MNLRTSFRAKLLLVTIVPLAVAQIVTLIAVMQTARKDVERRASNSLVIGSTVAREFLAARGEQLRASAQVLVADFGLKEAAGTRDAETLRSVLTNHSQRVGADIALFLDLEANLVAGTENIGPAVDANVKRLVYEATGGRSGQSILHVGKNTYQTFTVPLRAPTQIGWIVLGFRVSGTLTDRIGGLTGLDVSIVKMDGNTATVITTTNKPEPGETVPAAQVDPAAPSNSVYLIDDGENERFTLSAPFVTGNGTLLVVLQRSLHDVMQPYSEARRGLIVFAVLLLVFVALGAAYVAGSIAKPVRVLTDAARRMISGHYDSEVEVKSDDEFGQLAASFNAMRAAISDREERISHQALHDSLTDLPNRNRILINLTKEIEQARRDNRGVAILSIRLSRMDSITSTLGHGASDELIRAAARKLHVNLEKGEILGHVGTNEFVLLLPAGDSDEAQMYADRIDSLLGAGVSLGAVNMALQTQIGIAEYPKHGEHAAELLRNASIARSEAEARSERVRLYETGRQDHYVRQLRIVNDMRGALQKDEIKLKFQPQISLSSGEVNSAEALVRWEHPEFGELAPDAFIPALEQAGTIVYLTRHVLAQAIHFCRSWLDQGFPLNVAINLSSRDLQDEYLPYYVLEVLKEHELSPHHVTLEITENTVMQDVSHCIAVLQCLRDIGVRIAIDDFGTGHSSLTQLKNIPLHELKIDKSFITDMCKDAQSEAIVRTTIDLAHNMGLEVVAEGVEDEQTIRLLNAAGCEHAQGYLMTKPVPSADMLEWLTKYKAASYDDRRKGNRAFAKKA